jgi:hypothetical protein
MSNQVSERARNQPQDIGYLLVALAGAGLAGYGKLETKEAGHSLVNHGIQRGTVRQYSSYAGPNF